MSVMKLYLASKSPRRQELLQMITTDFTVVDSDFDEKTVPLTEPEQYAISLACGKEIHASVTDPDALIIGGATVVVSPDGRIFGKPADEAEGFSMLKTLSGQTHSVITGVCLHDKNRTESFAVRSEVTFYPLSDEEIAEYLACGEYKDKAGAYGIQGKGGLLCKKIDGDYFNIVGFPAAEISRRLKARKKSM